MACYKRDEHLQLPWTSMAFWVFSIFANRPLMLPQMGLLFSMTDISEKRSQEQLSHQN